MGEQPKSGGKTVGLFVAVLGIAVAAYGLYRLMSGIDDSPTLAIVGTMTGTLGAILAARAGASKS